jgi:hypothetical protein
VLGAVVRRAQRPGTRFLHPAERQHPAFSTWHQHSLQPPAPSLQPPASSLQPLASSLQPDVRGADRFDQADVPAERLQLGGNAGGIAFLGYRHEK